MSKWMSVKDKLPQLFRDVMVFPVHDHRYSDKLTSELRNDGRWFVTCEDSHHVWDQEVFNVTHWMSLPEPPKV